jgi:spore coat polysaccharide biosynthesis protein SpsF
MYVPADRKIRRGGGGPRAEDSMTANRRTVLIIQARMGSTRLPGKSMLDLAGAPLLDRLLERACRTSTVDEIVVATTQEAEDDVLEAVARGRGVAAFRGATSDLVGRYHDAARAFRADVVIRLPADNPVVEPKEIDRIVGYHASGAADFATNISQVFGNGYPDGIGAEVFAFDVLADVHGRCHDPVAREHVHRSFFDYATGEPADPGRYSVGTVACPEQFRRPDLVLDVNTREEYEFMKRLYDELYPQNPSFHITDIIRWVDGDTKRRT